MCRPDPEGVVDADHVRPDLAAAPAPVAEPDAQPALRAVVVVGIDGSAEATAALRVAWRCLQEAGCAVVLVRPVPGRP